MPLPDPTPDLASLDLLASVAATGSIRQAAAVHRISQPAASQRLAKLERVLGVELLDRTPGGARPTPAGNAVVEWSERVLEEMRALVAGAAALRREGRTEVRVAASMTVAEYLAPGWLVRMSELDPDVRVSLEMANSEQVLERVRDGRVALGFVEGVADLVGLRDVVVADDELVLVVAPGHPWVRRRGPLPAGELAATPLVVREVGSGTREVLDRWLGGLGLEVHAQVELGSTTAIKRAVESGVAPAVLSRLALGAELRDGRLVEVPVDGAELTRSIRAVWSGTSRPGRAADRVLRRILESHGAPGPVAG